MDRYEYKLRTEQIQKLVARKEYKAALQVIETIDWRKVKDVKTLSSAAEGYIAARRYEEALDLLEQAYENAPIGRRIIYRLTEVAILAKNIEAAHAYLQEFKEIAPNDSGQYILEYRLAKLQRVPLEQRISILEQYQQREFEERWSYELAKLYADAGRIEDCIKLCDDIVLWFNLGKYVDRALALKAKYVPLTASQQDRVNNPDRYKAKFKEAIADSENEEQAAPEEEAGPEPSEEDAAAEETKDDADSTAFAADEGQPDAKEQMAEEDEEPEPSKGMHRLKFPGFSWIFGGGANKAAEAEEPEDAASEEPEEEMPAEEMSEHEPVQTEDDTEWITGVMENILEETEAAEETYSEDDSAQEENLAEREMLAAEKDPAAEEIAVAEKEAAAEEIFNAGEEPVKEERSAAGIEAEYEASVKGTDEAEYGTSAIDGDAVQGELEQLLHDPTVRSAAETGDVFAAAIRPAEEEAAEAGEEDEILAGQLEFDFLRMDAVAKAKEEREKELGIWDDPFRELVMQEPEEELHIRTIFSSTEEELLQSSGLSTEPQAAAAKAEAEPKEEAPAEAEAEEETAAEAEPKEEASAEAETKEEASAEAEPKEETAAEAEVEKEALAEAETKEEASAEAEVEKEALAEAEVEEETAAEAEAEPKEEASAEAEPEKESAAEELEADCEPDRPQTAEPAAEAAEPGTELLDESERALRLVEAEVHKALMEDEMLERERLLGNGGTVPPILEKADTMLSEEETEPESELLTAEAKETEEEETEPVVLLPETEEEEPEPEMALPEEEEEYSPGVAAKPAQAWSRYNMLVRSEDTKAGIELAMGFLTRIPAEERMPSVAKTYGGKLNRKNWEELEEHLRNRILVVGDANEMDDECLDHLREYLIQEGHMAVLIDTEENIAEIGLRNKALLDMFPTEYAYYEYSSDEIVHHGVEYAQNLGWSLDDMAMLAYYAAVENMPDTPKGRELIEAENIIDDAIEMAEQKTALKLVKKVFGGKKEKGNILREAYFRNH